MSTPCLSAGSTAERLSVAALALPGRLMMSVPPRRPAIPRESIPRGVICTLAARIVSAMPGATRFMTASVASGVTSRREKPVPPVVTARHTSSS